MNKKFSTLLVGALLASSMSVVAQTPGKYATSMPLKNSGDLYQLHVGPMVDAGKPTVNAAGVISSATGLSQLAVDLNGNLVLEPIGGGPSSSYNESLWCATITTENSGKNPIFDFGNKAHGFNVAASVEDAYGIKGQGATTQSGAADFKNLNVSYGNLAGWKFSSVYEGALEQGKYLATYFTPDSILVLTKGKTATTVGVKRYGANEETLINADTEVLRFYVYIPGGHYLTALEYNTVFGTEKAEDYRSLKFSENRNNTSLKNPFYDYALKASTGGKTNFLNFQRKEDDHFLRVDTSYANSVGVKFLNFAFGKAINTGTVDGNLPIPNHYEFLLEYFVHNDSIAIDVYEARYNLENEPLWYDAMPTEWGVQSPGNPGGSIQGTDSLHLKLQDLVTADKIRIITIGTTPVNTKAYWGIGGCAGGKLATTVENNLYTIKNTRGQHLIVPVYTDSVSTGNTFATRDNLYPAWVTLEGNIDPNQIPAYQWIVEKTRVNDTDNTSPVRLRNREFGVEYTVQLTTDADGVVVGFGHLKPDGFIPVPDAQKKDQYLGYKFVDREMSSVYSYVFNYLHNFDDSKYLGVKNTATDSLMYVGGKTNFQIIPMAKEPSKYGAMPTKKEGNLKDVAQLVRHSYMLKINDASKLENSNKVVVVDQEKRYAVTDSSWLRVNSNVNGNQRTWGVDTAIFYLKTNNTKHFGDTIRNYYALLDTNSFTPNWASGGGVSTAYNANKIHMVKAGVDDDNLWVKVQNHKETRTSAFAVEVNDDPLYRRFNRLTEGSVANDNPDTVKFFRMNEPADMLYEDAYSVYSKPVNPNAPVDQINFLGVKNHIQYDKVNYAIYVDTAYVARPATKESLIDTPKPQYMLVMNPQIVPAGKYCPIHGPNADCADEHLKETKGYVRGRYLINATDSAKMSSTNGFLDVVRDKRYLWDNKWERLVFVDAIHMGDSLYLLKEDFKADFIVATDSLVKASYAVFNLANNYHKDVVFSFRLIDNDPRQDFLIESETTDRDIHTGLMIAPMEGGWVKWHNGVPVISRGAYNDKIVDAERWNVVKTDEKPLANDEITVGDDAVYNVIAGVGTVTIKNAAGKQVAISNILGQTIANVALTNDNQTISVPAGIVVVAVDGEAAVKAIVR